MIRHTRLITTSLLLALSVSLGSTQAIAQNASKQAKLDIILVEASNAGSGIDQSLKPYSGTLKRLFRFNSYKQVGTTSATAAVPGETTATLGRHKLNIKTRATRDGISADLNWSAGIHARVNLRPGKPAVLGGPKIRSGDGNYLLLVKLR